MKRVLLTGAAGGVGTRLRRILAGRFPTLVLSDIREPADLLPGETFVEADLSNSEAVMRAVDGCDGIIHLGGLPFEYEWDKMLEANIIGTYNVFEAARLAGVRRMVFASTNQVVGFYPRDRRFGVDVPLRPSSRYGVTKAFGESLAALYADKHGLRSLCIRIGRVADQPEDLRRLALWIHPEDLAQLMCIGLEHPDIHYDIVYGVSHNERSWYDNRRAGELGYAPIGRAEDFAAEAAESQKTAYSDPISDRFMGAKLCSLEYSGDPERSGT
ncbi:NAD(P)-dependent oxidoreductase [Tropicimonas sp. IMCC34043]|uniref:NAD-dependent epimerase/dehydratase family protein n=1 Tax=Tropicimonas sp. IMCC34043 TaxID=2248760 RepID=UPI000E230BC0|nr:NAD(P)-dependent oxidoreductase [Tropicimonas sp. IMCC34043]